MTMKLLKVVITVLILGLSVPGLIFPQQQYKPPQTILPETVLKSILTEISGQLAFDNEVILAGYNHLRSEEEFKTFFYEGEYLAKKLKEYGVDEVRLEDVAEKMPERKEWWMGVDAELWMKEPEEKRLSRLLEHPALLVRGSDPGEWEGEVVYVDRRDRPKLKDMDLKGKILLTPDSPAFFREAFAKGALGVISYYVSEEVQPDPGQVMFNMNFLKGETESKVFCFQIWRELGEQLKNIIFKEEKLVLRASAKTATYPYKLDTIFACIKGKNPLEKGLMFTAHLFERPFKQGANDNVSGCVTLAEIARTITTLIKQGKIERPGRSIYFLMGEEGSGTMAFFRKYPEMADKILGVINVDMVGEDLGKNQAFFLLEKPFYSRTSFLEALTGHFTEYVVATNTEQAEHGMMGIENGFPLPIVEKNGSRQPFRYMWGNYLGSSDHGMFIETDTGIPAMMFSVWPDRKFHSDKDRPDNSDPTQLKRTAFIGTACALAVCSGSEEILQKLISISYQERLAFIQGTLARGINELSLLDKGDNGTAYSNAVSYITQAVVLSKKNLAHIHDLTRGKKPLENYLNTLIKSLDYFLGFYKKNLVIYYREVAALKGFSPGFALPSPEEKKLQASVPVKVDSIPLGKLIPSSNLFRSLVKAPELSKKIFSQFGHLYLLEMYLCIDGKRNLAQIRDLLSFEFETMAAADFLQLFKLLEEAKLIRITGLKF